MNEWLHGEIVGIIGIQTSFSLGMFHSSDSADRTELVAKFECDGCRIQSITESLQWSTQAVVDLWIEEHNESLLEGCMGEDTATALRIELRKIAAVR